MSGPLSDIVTLTITQDSVGVARAAFATPLILSHTAAWAERVRTYSSILEVADDFASDTPEYLAASAIFAQTPHPETVKIGRAANKPTMRYSVDAVTAATSTNYKLTVRGVDVAETELTYASGATATVAEIHRALVNKLNSTELETLTFVDKTVSVVDTTDNELDFGAAHSLQTGDGPIRLENTGGALPAGLAAATDYYVINVDSDSISLATSRDNALEGVEVDITGAGTGTHTVVDVLGSTKRINNNYIAAYAALVYPDDTFTAAATDICTNVGHGLLTGDGPFQVSSSGTLPAGLTAATNYWVIKLDADTFKFASTLANAMAGTAVDITDAGTGTHTIADTASTVRPDDPFTVTGDAAGNWFSLEVGDASLLTILMNHADPGVAADLTAISNEDDSWYMLYTMYNSKDFVAAVAAAIEPLKKMYIPDVCDTAALTVAYVDGLEDDILAKLHTLAYKRTGGFYHQAPGDMAGAAWIGAVVAYDVGSATWAHKTLAGVSPTNLTSTHRTNLDARKANWYETTAGLNKTKWGYTADGGFIDTQMGIDWIDDDMTKSVFEDLAATPKVPFTDDGVAIVENAVRGSLKRATDRGILAKNPKFVVTVPLVKNVSTANKSIRNLPDVKWSATLAGAVHKVKPITGVVSL